jgi:hypothetical protein
MFLKNQCGILAALVHMLSLSFPARKIALKFSNSLKKAGDSLDVALRVVGAFCWALPRPCFAEHPLAIFNQTPTNSIRD